MYLICCLFFFFKQKTAYEMRISDWSSDVCSSDLNLDGQRVAQAVECLRGGIIDQPFVLDEQVRVGQLHACGHRNGEPQLAVSALECPRSGERRGNGSAPGGKPRIDPCLGITRNEGGQRGVFGHADRVGDRSEERGGGIDDVVTCQGLGVLYHSQKTNKYNN